MSEPAHDGLVGRVERLEIENRRLKRIGLAAAVFAAGAVLLGPATGRSAPKVLKARELQVVDDAGAARISLRIEANGEPWVAITGTRGSGIDLRLAEERPLFSLRDENRARATLTVGAEGTTLDLEDSEGKRASKLEAGGALGLFVNDVRSGRHGASLNMGESGPSLSLSSPDEAGAPTIGLQISPALGPLLAVTRGLAGAALGVSPEDDPSLTITDAQGHERAVLGVTKLQVERRRWDKEPKISKKKTDPSSIVLFDAGQTVVFKAP